MALIEEQQWNEKVSAEPNSFAAFAAEIRDSCETHAKRKNYTTSDMNGDNQLLKVCSLLGIHEHHAIGEIIYKCAEFLTCKSRDTKRLLCVKMAGWAWTIWREL